MHNFARISCHTLILLLNNCLFCLFAWKQDYVNNFKAIFKKLRSVLDYCCGKNSLSFQVHPTQNRGHFGFLVNAPPSEHNIIPGTYANISQSIHQKDALYITSLKVKWFGHAYATTITITIVTWCMLIYKIKSSSSVLQCQQSLGSDVKGAVIKMWL